MTKSLTGKVAIITGSSQGIGKAIAVALLNAGCKVMLNGRNQERLETAFKDLSSTGEHISYFQCDVTDADKCKKMVEYTVQQFGKVDIVINNAGVSMRGHLADLDPDVIKRVFRVNVFGSINMSIAAIPELRKTEGSLVFISSLAGIRGFPDLSAYSASKMALRAIAESIRIEERKHNIHVGLVLVGYTEIEHNKETIGADGNMITLKDRKGGMTQSVKSVAKSVLKNIKHRKYISTLTFLGKLNALLQARFPLLVEKIILKNIDKFDEGNK